MSSTPKKVSRFKSDRVKREDVQASPLPASAPKTAILGGIVEIKDTQHMRLGEVQCTTPSGFPSPARLKGVSFAPKHYSSKAKRPMHIHSQAPKESEIQTHVDDDDVSSDDFAAINMKRVANMTEADVKSALQEISASISTSNLEFLRRRGEKDLQQSAPLKPSVNTAAGLSKAVASDPAGGSISSDSSGKFRSKVPIADINHQQRQGERLQADCSNSCSSRSGTSQIPGGGTLSNSTGIRFDLSGRRIIFLESRTATPNDENNSILQWVDILSQSFLQYELLTDELYDIALYCVKTLANCDFTLSLPVAAVEEEPVHQGLHSVPNSEEEQAQESEATVVGYSLSDACRFMCSEVKSQRLVGLRILNGAMSRRDVASSSEAYRMAESLLSSAALTSTAGEESNVVSDTHAARQGRRPQIPFCRSYANLFNYIVRKVASSPTTAGQDSAGAGIPAALMEVSLSRVLTFAILKTCCAADFPPEVAYLLQWNLADLAPRASSLYQVQSLKAAFHFMFSGLESRAGDEALWTGVWGLYGAPFGFMTPLARRPEGSYATHVEACLRKYRAARADNEHNQSYRVQQQGGGCSNGTSSPNPSELSGIAKRPYEEFAMLCRWNRVNVMLHHDEGGGNGDGMVTALHRIMEDALYRIHSVCQLYSEGQVSFFDNVQRADDDVLMVADALIWCSKLISNSIRSGDIESVEILHRTVIVANWPKLLTVFSFCVNNGLLFPSNVHFADRAFGMKLKCICTCMWKMAAELARRSIKYAEMICAHNNEVLNVIITLISMCTVQAKARGVEFVHKNNNWSLFDDGDIATGDGDQSVLLWALRFWRCCVSYRLSMDATLNLLLHLHAELGDGWATYFSRQTHVEILEFLEEVTVINSAYFVGRSSAGANNTVKVWGADEGVSILDLMYIDISRVLLQITAILVKNMKKLSNSGKGGSEARRASSVANSFRHLVASVIGVGVAAVPASATSVSDPLAVLLTSHIRGPGLCASLIQFSTFIQTGNEQLQSSLTSITTTIAHLKSLFTELMEMRCVANFSVLCNYGTLFGGLEMDINCVAGPELVNTGGGMESMSNVCLILESILSSNRVALCYFSIMLKAGKADTSVQSEIESPIFALCRLVSLGEEWIREHEQQLGEDSVTAGLSSVQASRIFHLIQVTHLQLFSLAHSYSLTHSSLASSPFSSLPLYCNASQKCGWCERCVAALLGGAQYVLPYLPALSRLAPFTACRCLHAVLSGMIAAALPSSSSCNNNAAQLVELVLKAAYGINKSLVVSAGGAAGSFQQQQEEDELTTCINSILRNLSTLKAKGMEAGAGADSGFLYCDNNSHMAPFSACSSLVNEHVDDHILFSNFSILCHIDQHWLFSALAALKGAHLHQWLRVLHHMLLTAKHTGHAYTSSAPVAALCHSYQPKQHYQSVERQLFAFYENCEKLAQQLYWLTRLPASNISTVHGQQLVGGNGGEEEYESVAADPLSGVAHQYQQLFQRTYSLLFAEKLSSMQWQLQPHNSHTHTQCAEAFDTFTEVGEWLEVVASTQNRSLFMSSKLLAAGPDSQQQGEGRDYSTGSNAASVTRNRIHNKMRNRLKNSAAAFKRQQVKSTSKGTGVEDLCERVVDSLANQHYDSCVHAASVSFILIPGMVPWQFREKLWHTLGEMQLLHLLETPLLGGGGSSAALVLFLDIDVLLQNYCLRDVQQQHQLRKQQVKASPVAVVVAIAEALLGLRRYSEERRLAVTQLGLFYIAYFIFHQPAGVGVEEEGRNVMIAGMKENLLMKLVNNCNLKQRGEDDRDEDKDKEECIGGGFRCVLVDVLRFASVLVKTESVIGQAFLTRRSSSGVTNEERGEEACVLQETSAAVTRVWAEALHVSDSSGSGSGGGDEGTAKKGNGCAVISPFPSWTRCRGGDLLPCLGYHVAGTASTLLDTLKDLCPDVLRVNST